MRLLTYSYIYFFSYKDALCVCCVRDTSLDMWHEENIILNARPASISQSIIRSNGLAISIYTHASRGETIKRIAVTYHAIYDVPCTVHGEQGHGWTTVAKQKQILSRDLTV